MRQFLEFEKPIAELRARSRSSATCRTAATSTSAEEVTRLEAKADRLLRQTYAKLAPWQKVQVARHPERPHCSDYIAGLITEWTPLAGDRFAEDPAVLGGLGRFRGRASSVIGRRRATTPRPASRTISAWRARKAIGRRSASWTLADRFGAGASLSTPPAPIRDRRQARGQAEAIARSIETCLRSRCRSSPAVIGEGGSGGAIALAAANAVVMLEHAVYSVISPGRRRRRSSGGARERAGCRRGAPSHGAGPAQLGIIDAVGAGADRRRPPPPARDRAAVGDAIDAP